MTTSTNTFSILSATQKRVAVLLSLTVTVAMLAANAGLVDHYTGQSAQAANLAASTTPATTLHAKG